MSGKTDLARGYELMLEAARARRAGPTLPTTAPVLTAEQINEYYKRMVRYSASSSTGWTSQLPLNAYVPVFSHPQNSVQGFIDRVEDDIAQREREGNKPSAIVMHGLTWHAITEWAQRHPRDAVIWMITKSKMLGINVSLLWEMPEWEWVFSDPPPPKELVAFLKQKVNIRPFADRKSASIKARGRRA